MAARLLHGTLNVAIYEIEWTRSSCCGLALHGKNSGDKLYATVDLDKARVARTRTINGAASSPRWNERFAIYCAHKVSRVVFTLKDDRSIGAALIGRAFVSADEVVGGAPVDRWFDILDEGSAHIARRPRIRIWLRYSRAVLDPRWSRGIPDGEGFDGVPRTFFRQRRGCGVSLYQDAHLLSDYIPKFQLSTDEYSQNHRCWEDIFDAISNAKHLIYIAGWSVYAKVTLIRDPHRRASDETLGELLKRKADDGLRVLVLVWDDRSSSYFKKKGLMATHDQQTADYFRLTKVRCVLCPRRPDHGKSAVQKLEISTMFTHHQKTVVVDAQNTDGSGKRTLVSFVGGIDLCNGRYDTQEHSLFRTLNTFHRYDFHQPNFAGASIRKGGPREPWHDIHCRLEGPVAWDVLYNFEQRWSKQVGDNMLIPMRQLRELLIRPASAAFPDNPEIWNVQLFRSIDGGVASGFPETPEDAAAVGLVTDKGAVFDRSIQDAYINAVRRAKDFIYIENQYFLGSSFGWEPGDLKVEDVGALHLIPKELSLKIASKIDAGERFVVYVVIPMWPEGEPESASVQAILDWQRRTMEMMYADVIGAIQRKNLPANPRDYLTFFCLGNRETIEGPEYEPPENPDPDSDYGRAQIFRRFMIWNTVSQSTTST